MKRVLVLAALLATPMVAGCSNQREHADPIAAPLPSAGELLELHNERVPRIERVWARAVITVRFTDEDGDRRMEQGNGFFQRRDSELLALDIGKVGETYLWFGADDDLYWLLNRLEDGRAVFGRHDRFTPDKRRMLGLPVAPRELLTLAALRPIDPEAVTIERDAEGAPAVVEADAFGAWRYVFANRDRPEMPTVVERLNADGAPVIRAELTNAKTVQLDNPGGFPPRIFGRLFITHLPSDSSISIQLDGDVTDGVRRGVPRPQAFDFDLLIDLLGPFDEVVDLDALEDASS